MEKRPSGSSTTEQLKLPITEVVGGRTVVRSRLDREKAPVGDDELEQKDVTAKGAPLLFGNMSEKTVSGWRRSR